MERFFRNLKSEWIPTGGYRAPKQATANVLVYVNQYYSQLVRKAPMNTRHRKRWEKQPREQNLRNCPRSIDNNISSLVHRPTASAPRLLRTVGRPSAVALHFVRCSQLTRGLGLRECARTGGVQEKAPENRGKMGSRPASDQLSSGAGRHAMVLIISGCPANRRYQE